MQEGLLYSTKQIKIPANCEFGIAFTGIVLLYRFPSECHVSVRSRQYKLSLVFCMPLEAAKTHVLYDWRSEYDTYHL